MTIREIQQKIAGALVTSAFYNHPYANLRRERRRTGRILEVRSRSLLGASPFFPMCIEVGNNKNYFKNNFEEVRGLTRQRFFICLAQEGFGIIVPLQMSQWHGRVSPCAKGKLFQTSCFQSTGDTTGKLRTFHSCIASVDVVQCAANPLNRVTQPRFLRGFLVSSTTIRSTPRCVSTTFRLKAPKDDVKGENFVSSPLTLNDDRRKGSPYCNARSGVMPTAHEA